MLKNLFRRRKAKDDQSEVLPLEQCPVEGASNDLSNDPKSVADTEPRPQKHSWFQRLTDSLSKTRKNLVTQIQSLLQIGRRIDEELMEEIEEILIQSDVGVNATMTLMNNVRGIVEERSINESADLEAVIKEQVQNILGQDNQSISVHDNPQRRRLCLFAVDESDRVRPVFPDDEIHGGTASESGEGIVPLGHVER